MLGICILEEEHTRKNGKGEMGRKSSLEERQPLPNSPLVCL